jgi:hypothetical protein
MNRKWIIFMAGLVFVALAIFFWLRATSDIGTIKVTLLSTTNDASGTSVAVFSVTNETKRLFVRGRSQIEVQGNASNEVTLVQITNVDYLKPRQSIVFSVRSPAPGRAWRLNFFYLGQLSLLERLRENFAWFLYRRGFRISDKRLRLTPVRDITTGWVNETLTNAAPKLDSGIDGPSRQF